MGGGKCQCLTSITDAHWSGAMVLGKLSVPGRPTNLDNSRAMANCACSRCERGLFLIFFSIIYHVSLPSPALCETV